MPDWGSVFVEINNLSNFHRGQAEIALHTVRRKYLQELHNKTGRNIIAYYSGWLSKPSVRQTEIIDEDKNGFMMAVNKLDKSKGLDLFLHTPGGVVTATQSIVYYLHKMFNNDIRTIIPQIAMSAGTMIACSGKEIVMGAHSNLGPIDPHLQGIPAQGVKLEFKRAFEEIKDDADKFYVWKPILQQYKPTFLGQCENAVDLSNGFVKKQLETVMFKGQADAKKKAARIVKKLTTVSQTKTHDRHYHAEDCEKMGLKIQKLETLTSGTDNLQDLVLTIHHCYMHLLMNTPAFKIIENHVGSAFIKNQPTGQS